MVLLLTMVGYRNDHPIELLLYSIYRVAAVHPESIELLSSEHNGNIKMNIVLYSIMNLNRCGIVFMFRRVLL